MDRRRFLASATAAGLGAVAGCNGLLSGGESATLPEEITGRYASFQAGPGHTGVADAAVDGSPGSVWSFSEASTETGHEFATPAVADGRVYVPEGTIAPEGGAATAYLTALDATNGEVEWQFSLGGTNVVDDAVLADGTLLQRFGGVLVAVDASSGAERWRLAADVDTRPTVSDGRVFVVGQGSNESVLYAVEIESGERLWEREFEVGSGGHPVQPAVADGTVYNVEWELTALDAATGRARWAVPTDRAVGAAPTVTEEGIFLSTEENGILAIDRHRKERRWWQSVRTEAQGSGTAAPASVAVADGTVYASCLWAISALDVADGSEQWSTSTNSSGPPVVADENVYVAGFHSLSSFSTSDGSGGVAFQTDNESGAPLSPAIVDDAIFYGSDELYALGTSA